LNNDGPDAATNVEVKDYLPDGYTYVAGSITGGTSNSDATAPTLIWNIASLANGDSAVLTLKAVVNPTGYYFNIAEVTARDQDDPDSSPGNANGEPVEDDEDGASVTPSDEADLSLQKAVDNPTAGVGSTVTFTLKVTNDGPGEATNVMIGDVIPSGFTYVAASITGGDAQNDAGAPTLMWTINSLANGGSTDLSFQATVNASGNYLNVAQVTASDQTDPDSETNNENGAPYEDDEDDAIVTPGTTCGATYLYSLSDQDPKQLTRVRLDVVTPVFETIVDKILYAGTVVPGDKALKGFKIGKHIGDDTEAMAHDPNTGTTYLISNRKSTSALFKLDLTTGKAYSIGFTKTSNGKGVRDINSLAFNQKTNELYGITVDDNRLLKINTTTAQVTMAPNPITTSSGPDLEGASFDHSVEPPVLYVISEYGNGEIYTVDLSSGIGTQVATTELHFEGIEFGTNGPYRGVMYGISHFGQLYTINRENYAPTLVAMDEVIDGEGLVLRDCVPTIPKTIGAVEETSDEAAVPTEFVLEQNYPNPFNPSTTIRFGVPEETHVTLKVHNLLGEEVATLVNGLKPAGSYNVTFDAHGLPSGVYLYVLQAGEVRYTKRFVLMK